MAAIDMKKIHKELFAPKAKEPALVQVPDFTYLMADGEGDPNIAPAFREAVELLYGLSYTMKFALKKLGKDYTVMPLEGLFWADDPSAFTQGRKHEWKWTMAIVQPKEADEKVLEAAEEALAEKRRLSRPLPVRLAVLREGTCAHIMHIGPYKDEGPNIATLHRFIDDEGYVFNGLHHEIYLSDPRRVKPQAMRTVIRQPVKRKGRG
jgi:hypothetical protein